MMFSAEIYCFSQSRISVEANLINNLYLIDNIKCKYKNGNHDSNVAASDEM